eukprot:gene97-949_t
MRIWVLLASAAEVASARSAPDPREASLARTLEELRASTKYVQQEAKDAKNAAKYYEGALKEASKPGGELEQFAKKTFDSEMEKNHVKQWMAELDAVQKEIDAPRPEKAAKAAAEAREPYDQAVKAYSKAQGDFAARATEMAQRAQSDSDQAKKLFVSSNQYATEGDVKLAEEVRQQSKNLMHQASMLAKESKVTQEKAQKIHNAIPVIADDAEKAAQYAYWQANPENAPAVHDIVPLNLVQ